MMVKLPGSRGPREKEKRQVAMGIATPVTVIFVHPMSDNELCLLADVRIDLWSWLMIPKLTRRTCFGQG